MTEYETRAAKIDWDGVRQDVVQSIDLLRMAWQASEATMSPEVHEQLVNDLYAPRIRQLAEFIAGCHWDEEEAS